MSLFDSFLTSFYSFLTPFFSLEAEKTAQNKLDRKTATDKEAEKAEKSQQLADAEQKLEDTKVHTFRACM